jgi:predicted nucleotidyltransferase
MSIIKSISISSEFDELSKKHHISWSEASRIGMSIMLGDIGVKEYDNNLNLVRKVKLFEQKLKEVSSEFEEFKNRYKDKI